MTPIEKAENALNRRIVRIQTSLSAADSDTARRFLLQSLVVCIGIGETLRDYVRMIGQYAQARHGELKPAHDTLTAQHADLLKSGRELLERLKASPTDRTIRKEIDAVQRNMAAIQKTLRRGANALQREIAPSMAMIDQLAESVRRFGDADQRDALTRAIKLVVRDVRELYRAHPTLEARDVIDPEAWEKSAAAEIKQATDFHEAYAQAGYRVIVAIDTMTMAVSDTPPRTTAEAMSRADESAGARVKAITARFTTSQA